MFKKFFRINEAFRFEWSDLSACLILANVVLIICGFWWAPVVGLVNCGLSLVLNCANRVHLNAHIINGAIIALNIFFLL